MCAELVKKALPEGGKVMIFVGRMEQDNAKHRRRGLIDGLIGKEREGGRGSSGRKFVRWPNHRKDAWMSFGAPSRKLGEGLIVGS